jgi:hypothetical protein
MPEQTYIRGDILMRNLTKIAAAVLLVTAASVATGANAFAAPATIEARAAAQSQTLPSVAPQDYDHEVTQSTSSAVFVLVTFPHCPRCTLSEHRLAQLSKLHPEIKFVVIDGSQFGYADANAPRFYGVIPGYGKTFEVEALPSASLTAFVAERAAAAADEATALAERGAIEKSISSEQGSFAAKNTIASEQRAKSESDFDAEARALAKRKSDTLDPLAAQTNTLMRQLHDLQAQQQPTQNQQQAQQMQQLQQGLETQIKVVQEQFKRQESEFQAQEKDLQARKAQKLSAMDTEHKTLSAEHDARITDLSTKLEAAEQKLQSTVEADRRAANGGK